MCFLYDYFKRLEIFVLPIKFNSYKFISLYLEYNNFNRKSSKECKRAVVNIKKPSFAKIVERRANLNSLFKG